MRATVVLVLTLAAASASALDLFGGAGDVLRRMEHGLHEMEKSAQQEALALEESLTQMFRGPAAAAAAAKNSSKRPDNAESLEETEDREDREDSSDEDDDDDDDDSMTGLEGFGDGFFGGFFGPQRQPWWKGPNVCVEREEIDESSKVNGTDDDASPLFGSFHFSSCQQTPTRYQCRTKMQNHGIRKTFVVTYKCCYGAQRIDGKPGCTKVDMKPMMDTLNDVGAHDFVELIRTSNLEDAVKESNFTVFAPSDDAIRDFTDSAQEANQVEFYSTGERRKRSVSKMEGVSMRDVVESHMTSGFFDLTEIANKEILSSEYKNSSLRLSVYALPGQQLVTVNCARVTSSNNYASNGVVHVVDRVLQPVTKSLAQLVKDDNRFTVLASLLGKAGMLDKLAETEGQWTLFAPTDAAFSKLDADVRKRLLESDLCSTNVVRHHLVPHVVCSSAVVSRATTTNSDGEPLVLERRDGKLLLGDAELSTRDVVATNGVLHVLDDVDMPDAAQPLSRVLASHNISTFAKLLQEAGLVESLDDTRNVTLFAPSDEALAQPAAAAELERRRSDPNALRDLLLYHSTGPAVPRCDLGEQRELMSGFGDRALRINVYSSWPFFGGSKGRATVECARVSRQDARACGGVVHEIDRLLLPPQGGVVDTLNRLGNYSTLARFIKDTGLESELQESGPYTLLAPSDAVFDSMDPADMELLLNDTKLTKRVIRNHIIPEMLCCSGIGVATWPFVNRVETLGGQYLSARRDHEDNIHIGSTTVENCDIMATDGIIHTVNRLMMPQRRKNSNFNQRTRNPNVEVFLYGL